jgi:hypothetical protein
MITENTIGPFSVFFTNINRQMTLAGHSHFATVRFTYRAAPGEKALGFPSFEDTHGEVQRELRDFFKDPFRDHTNEDIARDLFEHFSNWTAPAIEKRGGNFALVCVELAVRGVPDRIGHADGFTVYNVRGE